MRLEIFIFRTSKFLIHCHGDLKCLHLPHFIIVKDFIVKLKPRNDIFASKGKLLVCSLFVQFPAFVFTYSVFSVGFSSRGQT